MISSAPTQTIFRVQRIRSLTVAALFVIRDPKKNRVCRTSTSTGHRLAASAMGRNMMNLIGVPHTRSAIARRDLSGFVSERSPQLFHPHSARRSCGTERNSP
jgi:hypothetical protein